MDGVAGIVSMRWWGVSTDTLAEGGRHMHAYLDAEGNLGLRRVSVVVGLLRGIIS